MKTKGSKNARRNARSGTVFLLIVAACLAALALQVGVSDNPPGIALLYAAGIALVLAGAHNWRTPRSFGFLLLFSAVGFVLSVLIHNFSEVGAQRIAHLPVLAGLLGGISVITFFLAVIVCPMGGLVGAIGGVITIVVNRHRTA